MAGNRVYRGLINGSHRYRLRVWDGTKQVSQEFHVAGGGKRNADAAADEELGKMVRRIARNPGSANDRTLADLWDAYLVHVVATARYSPTTLRDHKAAMKTNILPTLGKIKLRELTSYRLDQFYAKEQERVSARTVLKYHRLLSTIFRQAERWGWIETSPTHNATAPQVPRLGVTAPGIDVVLKLVQAAKNDHVRLLILLAASLGARRGELVGLRWEDIDYKAGTVVIQRSIYETPGGGVAVKPTKTDRPRTITLDTRSLNALRGLSEGRSGYVFSVNGETPWRPTRATRSYENVRKLVPTAKGFTLHDLRHFHATALIALGFDPATVAKRLGHADITTTLNTYTAALNERDRAASNAMGELLKVSP